MPRQGLLDDSSVTGAHRKSWNPLTAVFEALRSSRTVRTLDRKIIRGCEEKTKYLLRVDDFERHNFECLGWSNWGNPLGQVHLGFIPFLGVRTCDEINNQAGLLKA